MKTESRINVPRRETPREDEFVVPEPDGNCDCASEDEFDAELDDSIKIRGCVNLARGPRRGAIAIEDSAVVDGSLKISMIKDVKEFRTKLQIPVFRNFRVFDQGKIEVSQAGSV